MSLARQNTSDAAKHLFDGTAEQDAANNAVYEQPIAVECVSDAAGFAALRTEWDALHEQADDAPVFMSWAWHHTWWSVFGDNNDLCLLCARLNGELVALMPLYIRHHPWPKASQVMFVGTGEGEADEVATEYLDVLAQPSNAHRSASLMMNWLDEQCPQMVFDFQQLLEDAIVIKALQRNDNQWILKTEHKGYRYRLDLQQLDSEIPMIESRLKRVKRSLRAVERDGGMTQTSVFEGFGGEQANDVLKEVSQLSDQRQRHARRSKSAFASPRFNQFHHRILPLLYQLDGADVQHFYLDGELCAALYCFYDKTSCHYYQSGFVQSMANRYMPLTVAHLLEIERNRAAGRHYYDFMRGDANSYKKEFNCETTAMVHMVRFPSERYRRVRETFTMSRQRIVKELKRVGVSRRR